LFAWSPALLPSYKQLLFTISEPSFLCTCKIIATTDVIGRHVLTFNSNPALQG
jgi:hypothetical protein